MKYGLIDFDLTVEHYWSVSWNNKALLNIGDAAEYMVIEQLYQSLGIQSEDMIKIALPELVTYRGETLIVAFNIALDSYVGYNNILENLSPDIIPVFLGMSFTDTNFSQKQIDCLKEYAPIGCRDERSYLCMKSLRIPCYLNGCMASVLKIVEEPISKINKKFLFVDVPITVLNYVPKEIRKDIVFLKQEIYCKKSDVPSAFIPSEWAKQILAYYNSKPKLIVTSRFHGAVLALAKDIPTIITLENYTFRFSWLGNYSPIYTEDTYSEIEWELPQVNHDVIREQLLTVAKQRIQETINKFYTLLTLTDMQRRKESKHEEESQNQVLYYQKVWKEIQTTWSPEKEYTYGFWGVNENTKKLFGLIKKHYPKAKLVDVYDMFKPISFEGIISKHPNNLILHVGEENYYLIISAYLASRVAVDIFERCRFPIEHAFLCRKEFIRYSDLDGFEG